MHTDTCTCVQSTESERGSDLQGAAAEITRFSQKNPGLGRGEFPTASVASSVQLQNNGTPTPERDFRLEDISPAVKKVEGNLSIVLEVLRV